MLSSKLQCHVVGLFIWSAVLGVVIVAAGGSTESASPTTENAGIEACKRVHNATSVDKDAIWCIGKLSKTMLVITRSRLVFELPLDSLNNTIDQFYLGNYAPVPLEKKWPVLLQDAHYREVKDMLYACMPARDAYSDYLTLSTWKKTDTTMKGGTYLDLKTNKVYRGDVYVEMDPNMRWISAGSIHGYYRLTNKNGGVAVRMVYYCYQNTAPDRTSMWPGRPCDRLLKCTMLMPSCTEDDQESYPLCKDGSDGLHVKKGGQCSEPITWDVWNGFVDSGKFYLFGKDFVFTFSEEAYNKLGTKVTVRKIPFGDFIQCGGNPKARDMDVTKKAPMAVGLIVAIILILVLCCLCILLCLMREAMARRKKKRKGKKGSRVRSSGLPGFGALTAMMPGASKRSKGPPSAAKKLSRRGGSKRSLLNSKAGSLKPNGIPVTRRSTGASGAGQPLTRRSIGGTKRSSNAASLSRGQSAGNNPATNRSSKRGRSTSRRSISAPRTNNATHRSAR